MQQLGILGCPRKKELKFLNPRIGKARGKLSNVGGRRKESFKPTKADDTADWLVRRFNCTNHEHFRGIFFIFAKIFTIETIQEMIARSMASYITNPRAYFIRSGQNRDEYRRYLAEKRAKDSEATG